VIEGCLQDRSFPVSEGEQLRDFCYVEDVVEGMLCALDAPAACGRVINLASGTPVTLRRVVEQVRALVGRGQPQFGQLAYRKGENMALWADVRLAGELLGWAPRVSLEEGLARTIEYYRSRLAQAEARLASGKG